MSIMYKDIITSEKYPAFYTLLNKNNFALYDLVIKSVKNIITQNNLYKLNINSITTGDEAALIKAIKNNFNFEYHFLCLFHYKENLVQQLKNERLKDKISKPKSKNIINQLAKLTIYYKR